jgi:hypothetical protein
LAEDARDLRQPADKPVAIPPVLKPESNRHTGLVEAAGVGLFRPAASPCVHDSSIPHNQMPPIW